MPSPAHLVPIICPACGSVLALDPSTNAYGCPHGHCFSPHQLATAMNHDLTRALRNCLRQLEERRWLLTRLAGRTEATAEPEPDWRALTQPLRAWLADPPTDAERAQEHPGANSPRQ